ncbi:MAG TPA: tetratricopeptide repeat protein [bacterium]|nr:tetratricopeptide repeat protein [bacterium]
MLDNAEMLRLIAAGNTLEGQRRLFSAPPDPEDLLLSLNRALLSVPSEESNTFLQQAQYGHEALLPRGHNQDQPLILYNLGCLALYQDDVQEAKRRFQHVLDLEPDNRYARHNLGYAHELMADMVEARREYERVVLEDPDLTLTRLNLALLLAQEGRPEASISALRLLHQQNRDNMGILLYLCRSLLARGIPEHTNEALELLENHPQWKEFLDLWECRAYAQYLAGLYEAAEGSFRELLSHSPENLFAHMGLIKVLAARGDIPALRQALEAYQALNPTLSLAEALDLVAAQ